MTENSDPGRREAMPDGGATTASPTISVLVSSYNYAGYVVDAVRSVLRQSYPALEIVVVDDGSRDDSVAVLRAAFGDDPRVLLIEQDNAGQLAAWRNGFAYLRGDVVALLDSDDLWEPGYLERIAAVYREHADVGFVYTNMLLFGDVERPMLRDREDRDLGISILLGAFVHRWQATATSALSLRRPLMTRILDMPAAMAAEWVSRPDDCLAFGSEILGARKFYLGDTLVRHREHGRNALKDYSAAPLNTCRYMARGERMLEFYRARAGVTPRWLRIAKAEFRTKPRPTFFELRAYSWLLFRAPMPLTKRIEHWFGMLSHYLRARRR
ncbi:glycosyltransferase family 2 protein [Luteimonas sp. BDR2-5]|uniref:glycosyltransferase family 2 protein n=1 Tax=Proluteimonas luteida TaxID=2878685 RepID=UPI001E37EB4A|nr:glycosyltransferase family 2 protein [Luteimonas sp. BDR2-5]MCD9027358.1 glycosyltransferase family 2 protein [Luteimonas sp. BDR2-5]